jgi:hypothetical protein
MAQISLPEAAARSGVPWKMLEAWAERGLLTIQVSSRPLNPPAEFPTVPPTEEPFVDEDELEGVVESMGWLHLSAQGWDGNEDA